MFGSCKSIFEKYSIFRKCYFPERKIFSCVWLHFKKFSEKYFLVFGEEEGKDKPDKPRRRTAQSHRDRRDQDRRRDRTARRSTSSAITPSIAIFRNERRRLMIAIDERARWTIAPLVDCAVGRSTSTLVDRCSPIWALSSLSLSPI